MDTYEAIKTYGGSEGKVPLIFDECTVVISRSFIPRKRTADKYCRGEE
jgi:hypothetical protein